MCPAFSAYPLRQGKECSYILKAVHQKKESHYRICTYVKDYEKKTFYVFAGKGNDNVYGRADDDHLRGGWGDDTIHGGTGSDTILAGQGHDTVYGGEGSDRVRAGWGDDKVFLGLADDHVFGGKGDDTLIGGMGRDTLNGGAGNDRLRGGANSDTFIFAKGRGMDTIADFDATMDVLELRNFGFSSPQEALSFGAQQGDDFVFSFDDGSGLILRDVSEAELSSVMIIL